MLVYISNISSHRTQKIMLFFLHSHLLRIILVMCMLVVEVSEGKTGRESLNIGHLGSFQLG